MIKGLWSVVKAATKGHLLLYLRIHLLPPRELDGREFITGLVPVLSLKRLPSLTTSKTQPPQGNRQPDIESLQLKISTQSHLIIHQQTIVLRLPTQFIIQRYSSANKNLAVLRRNRSDPLSRAMGWIGELRAGSRSAGYERFGTGNLAPLAVLVPIPRPATHSNGVSNQHPHCTVNIWMYHVGSHWIAVKIYTGQQVNSQTSVSTFFRHVTEVMHWNDVLVTCYLYINKQLYTYIYIYIYIYFRDINNHLLHYTFILTGEIKTKALH